MKTWKKDDIINFLITDDIDNIRQMCFENDLSWIDFILREGFIGYRNQSISELRTELIARLRP